MIWGCNGSALSLYIEETSPVQCCMNVQCSVKQISILFDLLSAKNWPTPPTFNMVYLNSPNHLEARPSGTEKERGMLFWGRLNAAARAWCTAAVCFINRGGRNRGPVMASDLVPSTGSKMYHHRSDNLPTSMVVAFSTAWIWSNHPLQSNTFQCGYLYPYVRGMSRKTAHIRTYSHRDLWPLSKTRPRFPSSPAQLLLRHRRRPTPSFLEIVVFY